MNSLGHRDASQVLDWIMSRQVHEYLDIAGRPVGEGRAAAFDNVQTEWQSCPYAGSRNHHARPMNVSALRQITPDWEMIVTLLSWLSHRFRTRYERDITSFDDLSLITGAGVCLADFLVLRPHHPLRSGEIPTLISGLYKVCLGFQLATFLGSVQERFADPTTPPQLPPANEFYDDLEAQDLLIGEAEVCAGSATQIMEAYDAITVPHVVGEQALPVDCTRLEIDWGQFDDFAHHVANIWSDLVQYVIQAPQYCPELADPRLPPDVQDRLNAWLNERAAQMRAGQTGLVVEIARAAQEALGRTAGDWPSEPSEAGRARANLEGDGLAATIVAWLHEVADADMRNCGSVVASALEAQLVPYDLYEANLLVRLNEDLNGLMRALGRAPTAAVSASALSQICGRTLRDWAAP